MNKDDSFKKPAKKKGGEKKFSEHGPQQSLDIIRSGTGTFLGMEDRHYY